ncbi:MAG: redoxin domain-containing protein [Alphaproteobacteria bacterium]|nr:redoxin domain-containing protein [Alphaproteobacteria bacterium]
MKKSTRIGILLAVLVIAVGAGLAQWLVIRNDDVTKAASGLITSVEIGGPFALTDHTGKQVTEKDYLGNFTLVFFGYTFCPDVCPTELGDIALALDELGDDSVAVTPVMISIDPERDTPEVLSQYVSLFHERLIGLTGSPEAIKQVADAYRIFYKRVDDPDYSYYLMDHTSFVYLLDPEGNVASLLRYGTSPEEMASIIRQHMRG